MLALLLDYINKYFCSTFLEIICNIFKKCLAGTNKNNAIPIFQSRVSELEVTKRTWEIKSETQKETTPKREYSRCQNLFRPMPSSTAGSVAEDVAALDREDRYHQCFPE